MILFSAAASLMGLVAVSAAVLLTALILRHPRPSRWLDNEAVAHGAGLVLTTGAFFAVTTAAAGLTGANIHYGIVTIAIAAVLAGSAYAFWKVFDIGERLARADAGQSPFARREKAPAAPVVALHSAAAAG
jgi:hypothetical protein